MSLYKDASLVMIPSAYKDGKLYSIRPTDGSGDFTFSRGSNLAATRVDVNGLIEKGRENLFTQSNNFGHSDWNVKAGTFTQGVADPDGGNNAWSWTATNTDPYLYQSGKSLSGVGALSIWVKGVGSTIGKNFELRVASAPYKNIVLTGEWQRVEHYNNTASGTSVGFEYGNPAVVGDVVHIYQAQYEQGLVATDYIETGASTAQAGILEDMPRLDYSGGASCPALLLEPQRTNLNRHSEYFSFWVNNGASITDNSITSPEGKQNASTITGVSGNNRIYLLETTTSGTTYTLSFYAKKGTSSTIALDFINVSSGTTFNFDTKTWGTNAAWDSFDYEELSDGWFRLYGVIDCNTTNAGIGISVASGQTAYIYGAQLESGSYPTSYIPTYGSSVTRSGDLGVVSLPNTLTDNYSVFAEVKRTSDDAENNGEFINFDSASNDRLRILTYNNSRIRFRLYYNDGTNDSFFTNGGDWNQGDTIKFCVTYDNGTIVIYANGVLIHTISQTLNNFNSMNIETQKQNQIALFNTTLTSSEAIALTTI